MSEEQAVNEQTAEADFERFATTWCLDFDIASMDEDGAQSFNVLKRRIVTAIMGGHLAVDLDGSELTYRLRFPNVEGLVTSMLFLFYSRSSGNRPLS